MKRLLLPFVAGMLLTGTTVNAETTGTIRLVDTWAGPYCSKFIVGDVTFAIRGADLTSNPNGSAIWQTVLRVADTGKSVTVSEPGDITGLALAATVFCNVEQTDPFPNPALIKINP
jgi:hypothetical protein